MAEGKGCSCGLVMVILRMVLGAVFMFHGSQKVLGLFGGPGMDGFIAWAGTLGIPAWLAHVVVGVEFVGGALLVLGIAVEVVAALVAVDMLGAIYLVHWQHGFSFQNGGFEYPMVLMVIALIIMAAGPGACALMDTCKLWGKGCACSCR